MPQPLNAVAFIRKMRGGSQSSLVLADDGQYYITKSPNNPQGTRTLVNEWIGFRVLQTLKISVACQRTIYLSAELIAGNAALSFERSSGKRQPLAAGLHLACRLVGGAKKVVYDLLPVALLRTIDNPQHFLGALVVDKWLGNADMRQCVFVRGNGRTRRLTATMIDHGQMLEGQNWALRDSPLFGRYYASAVYAGVRSLSDFSPWLEGLSGCDRAFFARVIDEIPAEWLAAGDRPELLHIVERLLQRREKVSRMIAEMAECRTHPFEHWYPRTSRVNGGCVGPSIRTDPVTDSEQI